MLVRENYSVNPKAGLCKKKIESQKPLKKQSNLTFGFHASHLKHLKIVQHDFDKLERGRKFSVAK